MKHSPWPLTSPPAVRHVDRRAALGALALGAAGVALTACIGEKGRAQTLDQPAPPSPAAGDRDFAARFAAYEPAEEPDGDLAKIVWPAFILRAGGDVKQLYEFQVVNGALMRYMPCFCGCQWEDGHRNNRDCYIDTVNADGSVVFDNMAPT